ncbi:SAM-dependent methyltransferase [Actinoallomurus iriomotensis]|uniref:S-adenosyl-L-methionine-dependent methyltransferase n=1 Tax=Actinoallomurus iriomotensis TaxID=478107 RepID=A0A9W6S673_9ACTN|nr:SAM-dependent methyltransferase [Actinoallomurus iriomotensis]GLY86457.1 S-adenosyl-L-methionine-dependent methyltransferase [Actinoallomurus iriomotensis]
MDTAPLSGVGATSLGVARARAWESRRPDRLFDDPYAAAFAAAAARKVSSTGTRAPVSPERARLAFHVIIRTRFYDDFLLSACTAGCRQVVLLAAGLDTRAYRLPWPPGVRLYELDLPEVLAFKDNVLTGEGARPRCTRTALEADLRDDWPQRLTGAGFDPSAPTTWLVEGLLVYLTAEEAATVLTRVGELSAPGSRISLERHNAASIIAERDREGIAEYASLWKGGLGQDTADWLDRHGWRTELHALADVAASYDRPIPDASLSGFLTATRGA